MLLRTLAIAFVTAVSFSQISTVLADPCGMVPPIYPGGEVPLARTGDQQTYVFYKDGVETFVIRPGFTGKVEDFGMLIPFPTPPAIRKVPDNIFPQIAAAVDPPEVVVDLRIRLLAQTAKANFSGPVNQSLEVLKRSEVRVLREEAVGMYEVAVLQAGSPAALKKWMDSHGYTYPKGMDAVCADYVKDQWCFVAVKTKVAGKKSLEPAPGQRNVTTKLRAGEAFDGFVQGMGFRFKSEELVVPMRLSAFNDGDTRNIVYLLSDSPKKIRNIPEEYVVRQVDGEQLYNNLTGPLPLRIIGGVEADIPAYRRKSLLAERNPHPANGAAKELFASDLLAVNSGKLALAHEQQEKALLNIGERLSLRGPEIDKVNADAVAADREKAVTRALSDVKKMTLTVVDGDFPREVIASKNLSFDTYTMPARRNNPASYDAKMKKPAAKRDGVLKTGYLPAPAAGGSPTLIAMDASPQSNYGVYGLLLFAAASVAVLGFLAAGVRKNFSRA